MLLVCDPGEFAELYELLEIWRRQGCDVPVHSEQRLVRAYVLRAHLVPEPAVRMAVGPARRHGAQAPGPARGRG